MANVMHAHPGRTAMAAVLVVTLGGCSAGQGGAASGAAPPPSPMATTFQYAPFVTTYRLASHNRTEQEFGGQVNVMEYATATFLTAEAEPSGPGSTALSLHVDSLVPLGPLPPGVSQDDLDGVNGSTFRGTMASTGEITDFQAGSGSGPLLEQLNQSMQRFFSASNPGRPGRTRRRWRRGERQTIWRSLP